MPGATGPLRPTCHCPLPSQAGSPHVVVHHLQLAEVPAGQADSFAASCASQLYRHFRLAPDVTPESPVWDWIASGLAGRGVPYFVSAWEGPRSVKELLQVSCCRAW